jgi:hypothetical protein
VSLPKRQYFLFQGPLDAAIELGWMLDDGFFVPQSPNLFWPDDHSWCVATEVDLDSTYLGGSEALVQRLLADRSLEVLSVTPSDPIDAGSDEINRLKARERMSVVPGNLTLGLPDSECLGARNEYISRLECPTE